MNILCQTQIWNEYGYDRFMKSLEGVADVEMTMIIPFTTDLHPEPENIPDVVFGSGRLVDIARERGWNTFPSFEPIELGLVHDAGLWVNGDGVETTLGELVVEERVFVKPFKEKLFTGVCLNEGDKILDSVQFSTSNIDGELEDERILVSPAKPIMNEYRMLVLGGEVVTGTSYRLKGEVKYVIQYPSDECWQFAKGLLTLPDMAEFCGTIDVSFDGKQLQIVEFNNLNSAGVYASDYDAFAKALKVWVDG